MSVFIEGWNIFLDSAPFVIASFILFVTMVVPIVGAYALLKSISYFLRNPVANNIDSYLNHRK